MNKLLRSIAIGWLVAVVFNIILFGLLYLGFADFVFIVGVVLLILVFCVINALAIAVLILPDFPS